MLAFLKQLGCAVELVALEEDARILSSESLDLIVELGSGDSHHFSHSCHIQF